MGDGFNQFDGLDVLRKEENLCLTVMIIEDILQVLMDVEVIAFNTLLEE